VFHPFTLIKGLGLGAGLMYLFDPQVGRRRRALLADQMTHLVHEGEETFRVGARDLRNRARGLVAEAASAFERDDADDRVIAERVRSKMGRVVSHPGAIEVSSRCGHVALSGPILASEAGRLISAVRTVRGVTGVEDRLVYHDRPGGHPALQGGATRTGERIEFLQESWSPATRLLLGVAGGMVALKLLKRSGLTSAATLGVLGLVAAAGLSERAGPPRPDASVRGTRRPSALEMGQGAGI
jgi:hypothetical protein